MQRRSVLIVEDLADTRAWLAGIAAEVFGVEPVLAPTLADARTCLAPPGLASLVALVDLGLPDGSGLDLIQELSVRGGAEIVVTSIFEDDATLVAAFAAGAHGYLLKSAGRGDVAARLRALDRGEVAISPAIARRLLGTFRVAGTASADLTARETEVLRVIGRGLTLAEAGGALGISGQTVATHVKAIYRKLNIASRAEAALEARRRGLA